jgi:hypothetical protein
MLQPLDAFGAGRAASAILGVVMKPFGALVFALLPACSHGSLTSSAAPTPPVAAPGPPSAPPRSREVPSPPDLSNRRLVKEETRVIGPRHPVLARHQGQRPIVHLSGFHRPFPPGAPSSPEQSPFELAVFEDGTLAFQGYPCGWGSAPTIARLSVPELAALRALVDRECFQLRSSNAECTDSETVRVRCAAGSRTIDLNSSCESHDETLAWGTFANEVRRLVRLDDRPPDVGVCAPSEASLFGSDIELAISPLVIVDKTYDVDRR